MGLKIKTIYFDPRSRNVTVEEVRIAALITIAIA
jgi:hypothetical protein